MAREIRTKKGLEELKRRYLEAGLEPDNIEVRAIDGCLEEGLAMDCVDYEYTPKELKKLWKGLK